MLLGSLPEREKQKLAVELKINLGVLSVKATGSGNVGPMDHRVSRLEAVVRQLQKTSYVGDFLSPGSYIADTLNMVYATQTETEIDAVAFGAVAGRRCLAMVGSARHIIGHVPNLAAPSPAIGASHLPGILRFFKTLSDSKEGMHLSEVFGQAENYVSILVHEAPVQRVEFFARRLKQGTSPGQGEVIIASPLYVALAD